MLPVTKPPPLRIVSLTSPVWRWLLLVPMIAALAGCYFVMRWCVGSTVAQTAADPALAQFAVRLSPSDPQTHFTLGKTTEASLTTADLTNAVAEYQQAVRLAPYDFRLWLILAGGRERAGDLAGAEPAFLRAESLAPNYAMPRWAVGNFLLRQGRGDEAFARLFAAGDEMETLRRPVLGLAFGYFGDEPRDVDTVIHAIGTRPELRRALVSYLIDRGRPEQAVRAWASLSSDERLQARAIGVSLVAALAAAHQYQAARSVANDIAPGENTQRGEIENRGFEDNVETGGSNIFGWRLGAGDQPRVALDGTEHHSGNRSLTTDFAAANGAVARDVTQLIVVDPRASYRLTYYVHAVDIKGAAAVRVQVLSASDNRVLAQSEPMSAGNSAWRAETFDFVAPDGGDGVIVRLGAVTCPAEACPVFGRIWYDDFELKLANEEVRR